MGTSLISLGSVTEMGSVFHNRVLPSSSGRTHHCRVVSPLLNSNLTPAQLQLTMGPLVSPHLFLSPTQHLMTVIFFPTPVMSALPESRCE